MKTVTVVTCLLMPALVAAQRPTGWGKLYNGTSNEVGVHLSVTNNGYSDGQDIVIRPGESFSLRAKAYTVRLTDEVFPLDATQHGDDDELSAWNLRVYHIALKRDGSYVIHAGFPDAWGNRIAKVYQNRMREVGISGNLKRIALDEMSSGWYKFHSNLRAEVFESALREIVAIDENWPVRFSFQEWGEDLSVSISRPLTVSVAGDIGQFAKECAAQAFKISPRTVQLGMYARADYMTPAKLAKTFMSNGRIDWQELQGTVSDTLRQSPLYIQDMNFRPDDSSPDELVLVSRWEEGEVEEFFSEVPRDHRGKHARWRITVTCSKDRPAYARADGLKLSANTEIGVKWRSRREYEDVNVSRFTFSFQPSHELGELRQREMLYGRVSEVERKVERAIYESLSRK